MKKLYLASSWKLFPLLRPLAQKIRTLGYDVYLFCDEKEPAAKLSLALRLKEEVQKWTTPDSLEDEDVNKIFKLNLGWMDACDILLLVMPSGKSAHLEAGYVKGRGRPIIAWGEFPEGDWDAMYGLFDFVFRPEQTETLFKFLERYAKLEVTVKRASASDSREIHEQTKQEDKSRDTSSNPSGRDTAVPSKVAKPKSGSKRDSGNVRPANKGK